MKLTTNGRQMSVRESLKELAEKKLARFDRIFGEEWEAQITYSVKRDLECVEITVRHGGTLFRSEEAADTFQNAMDAAVETLLGQIRRNKTRLSRQLRDSTLDLATVEDGEDEGEEFTIRRKSFPIKPMSVEEAILQMEMLRHDFFVFKDAETLDTCVVYKRKDGAYGLIAPEEE